ncbi:hypothetical protein AOL_s00210g200 [Orbilia oligospora ATCC 24927]|uniref:Uncharacterized protein n=1 Tax=Arthrobotrys oligospora (strain ATCC 24927 / CBS 115.81 / DSM 1491) TaxID=756982 RepID=G1XS42_ARTOA|nr:hypothetical protein AOL_s00210g200 [Orbilia oligospora ATCC 24927]EGX44039.1 hypothetical protein AOL_s00210g200 [Orbilia oligospora ATCC 24927]
MKTRNKKRGSNKPPLTWGGLEMEDQAKKVSRRSSLPALLVEPPPVVRSSAAHARVSDDDDAPAPSRAVPAPHRFAPARHRVFDSGYRVVSGERYALRERLDIVVEIQPFGFPGAKALFRDLGVQYGKRRDDEWHQEIERAVLHQTWGREEGNEKPNLLLWTTPLAPNDGCPQVKIDGVNHPDLNIVQNRYHNSAKTTFHVKIMLRQSLVLFLVISYLIYKEGLDVRTSQKSLKEVAEVVLKITLAILAGLGAIYGFLAGVM